MPNTVCAIKGCNNPRYDETRERCSIHRTYSSVCPECGTAYSPHGGGHCRGGSYGGCCKTFTSDSSADAHFRWNGPVPRCLTDQEMSEEGWRFTGLRGWSNAPEMPQSAKDAYAKVQDD